MSERARHLLTELPDVWARLQRAPSDPAGEQLIIIIVAEVVDGAFTAVGVAREDVAVWKVHTWKT